MWLVYTEQRALPEVDRSLLQGTLHRQQGIMLITLVGQGVVRGQNGQNLGEVTVTSTHSQVRSEAGVPHTKDYLPSPSVVQSVPKAVSYSMGPLVINGGYYYVSRPPRLE